MKALAQCSLLGKILSHHCLGWCCNYCKCCSLRKSNTPMFCFWPSHIL